MYVACMQHKTQGHKYNLKLKANLSCLSVDELLVGIESQLKLSKGSLNSKKKTSSNVNTL